MISIDDILGEEYAPTDRPMRIGSYVLGAIIGEGKSGIVRRGTRDGDKTKVAVKVLNKLVGHQGTLIQLQFQQEVEALRRLNHSHVIAMHECIQSTRRFYIVLDLLQGELLSHYVAKRFGLPEIETKHLTRQLLSALAYMHRLHVVHRDLKPDNVILDTKNMHATIIDLGLSACTSSTPRLVRHCGTPAYMAPEVTSAMGYGYAVDMWSLGVSIVEMIQGYPPHLNEVHRRGNYPKMVQRREMFASLPSLSKDCLNFLDRALQIYPERRLSAEEAQGHEWLREPTQETKGGVQPRGRERTPHSAPQPIGSWS